MAFLRCGVCARRFEKKGMAGQYAIARHTYSGIGDHISCLVGSWYIARRSGRTLVVDWRGSRFSDDPTQTRNAFCRWFSLPDEVEGVPVITYDPARPPDLRGPFWPSKWSGSDLADSANLRHSAAEVSETAALVASNDDRPEPVAVFDAGLLPWPPRDACATFFRHLQFTPEIEEAAAAFRRDALANVPAIAIHIRHGNGENIGARAAYWLTPGALVRQLWRNRTTAIHGGAVRGRFHDNMPDSLVGTPGQRGAERRFLRRVARIVKQLKREAELSNAKPLLFTDAPHIFEELRRELPDLVSFEAETREPDGGPLHQVKPIAVNGRDNAVATTIVDPAVTRQMMLEMAVMRGAAGLVRMESGFTAITWNELPRERLVDLQPTLLNRLILKLSYKI